MITGHAPAGVPANLFDTVEQQEQEQVPDELMYLPRTTYQPPVASRVGVPANLPDTVEHHHEQQQEHHHEQQQEHHHEQQQEHHHEQHHEQQQEQQVPEALMLLPRTTYQPPVASPAAEPANLSNTAEQQQEQVPEELMLLPRTTYQPPAAPPAGARPDHGVHNDHEAVEAGEADDDASINVVFERSSSTVSVCSSVSNFSCRYCKSLSYGGIHYPHNDDEDDGGYGGASAGGYPLGGYPAHESGPSAENDKDGASNGKNDEASHRKDKGVSDDKEGMSLPKNKESDIVNKDVTESK